MFLWQQLIKKDAYLQISIQFEHQNYLKFILNQILQFVCMSEGYRKSMRIFLKVN